MRSSPLCSAYLSDRRCSPRPCYQRTPGATEGQACDVVLQVRCWRIVTTSPTPRERGLSLRWEKAAFEGSASLLNTLRGSRGERSSFADAELPCSIEVKEGVKTALTSLCQPLVLQCPVARGLASSCHQLKEEVDIKGGGIEGEATQSPECAPRPPTPSSDLRLI